MRHDRLAAIAFPEVRDVQHVRPGGKPVRANEFLGESNAIVALAQDVAFQGWIRVGGHLHRPPNRQMHAPRDLVLPGGVVTVQAQVNRNFRTGQVGDVQGE